MPADDWVNQPRSYSDARAAMGRPSGIVAESYSYDLGPHQLAPTSALVSQRMHMTAVFYQRGQIVSNIGWAFGPTVLTGLTNWTASLYSHDTAPTLPTSTVTVTTASGSATLTSATQPQNVINRFITGSGIPAGAYVSTGAFGQIVMSTAATASATITATLGQFAFARAKLIGSATSAVVPTAGQRNALAMGLSSFAATYVIPATGWYYHALVVNAATMPDMVEQAVLSTTPTYIWGEAPIKCGYSSTGITGALPNQAAALTVVNDRLYTYST